MDAIVSNESGKRRLPLWMLGVAAADQVSKSENEDVNDVVIIEEEGIVSQCRPTKSKARRTARRGKEVLLPDKEASEVDEPSLPLKRETRRTKRKVNRQDGSCDDNDNDRETACEKRKRGGVGRTVRQAAPRKRQKAKSSGFESSEEIEVPSPNEDEGDLTMEDLMSIAKEFVKDDNDMVQEQPSDGEHKVESQFSSIAFSRNEQGGSLNARSPTRKETASCHNSAENLRGEGVVVNPPSMTGDPTKDMLDLFLGPLLKKPLYEEKVKSITEDIMFAREYKKLAQKVDLGEPPVPLTKKKSSLKDKVAAFLD